MTIQRTDVVSSFEFVEVSGKMLDTHFMVHTDIFAFEHRRMGLYPVDVRHIVDKLSCTVTHRLMSKRKVNIRRVFIRVYHGVLIDMFTYESLQGLFADISYYGVTNLSTVPSNLVGSASHISRNLCPMYQADR